MIAAALTLLALGWLALEFHQWRLGKLAELEVPPAGPIAAGTPAAPRGLLLFGDSRIAQWKPRPLRPYPVAVEGFPGASAIRLVPAFDAALARHRPALVVVQLGANDAVAASLAGGDARAQALADSKAALRRMAAAARAHGAELVFVETIPPVRPDPLRRLLFGNRVNDYIAALNAALPALAAGEGARVVSAMPLLKGPDGEVPAPYRRDWLHLTAEAYAALDPLLPASLDPPATAPIPESEAAAVPA